MALDGVSIIIPLAFSVLTINLLLLSLIPIIKNLNQDVNQSLSILSMEIRGISVNETILRIDFLKKFVPISS